MDNIKELLHGMQPFVIRMVSGRAIEVPHPDFAALSRSNTSLLLSGERDRVEIIRLSQIERIESTEGATNA
ncbi:MAG TPA: hypothetical protein VHE13_11110 [Opitutus sp.]|nr:hypothetical protein [Opitutus sp.]